MKVKEVIEKLKRFDQEKEIRVDNNKRLWFRYNEDYISIEIEEKKENELKLNELDVQKLSMKKNEVLVVNVCIKHARTNEEVDRYLESIKKAFNHYNINIIVSPYVENPVDLKVIGKEDEHNR